MDTDNHIFERDIIASAELCARRSGLPDPERSLMLAVLEEAMHCFLKYGTAEGKARVVYEEARDWFESGAHTRLYDFENVCDVLGIDASWLRRRLHALRARRHRAEHPTWAPSAAATATESSRDTDDWQDAG